MGLGPDEIMTIQKSAGYLRILRSTLHKPAQEGNLLRQKVGKRWRFRKEAVNLWLENDGPKK